PLGTGLVSISDGTSQVAGPMLADSSGQNLYVAGSFERAGGVSVDNIARWDGTQWYRMGSEFEGTSTSALIFYNNELYVASHTDPEHGMGPIGKWNGTNWILPPTDTFFFPVAINAFAVFHGELYAG